MRGEPVELSCPFCDKGKIQCWYIAGNFSFKRAQAAHTSKNIPVRSSDIWLIKSEKCPTCDKSKEEIEKELKRLKII
jgi:hypothetical protein